MLELFAKPVSTLPKAYQYYAAKHGMSYQVCEADGCHYIFQTQDDCISRLMIDTGETFAKEDMDFVFENVGKEKGLFLDIGANIGTTSVYVKKCINPDIDVIAFEPLKENFDLLRINTILNHCEDIRVEQYGLSDTSGVQYMKAGRENCGGSHIVSEAELEKERIECITLDEYMNQNAILPENVKYIWIDVEGHEPHVITGARQTLLASDASVFMEYNSAIYKRNGTYDGVVADLKEIYHYFICAEQAGKTKAEWRSITELGLLAEEVNYEQCNILLKK